NCLLRFLSESEGGSVASVGRDLAAWTAVPIFTAPPVEEPGHATSLPRAHRCADRLRPCPRCRMWSTARWDARWQRQPTDRAAAAHPPRRGPHDGEPILRPLPRLAPGRRRQAGRAHLPRCRGREPPDVRARPGLPGLRAFRSGSLVPGRTAGGGRRPDGWLAESGTERCLRDRLL